MTVIGLGSVYGNCGFSPKYDTSSNSPSGRKVQNKKIKKKGKKKSALQNHYEKRKYLRKKFEKRQAVKEMYAKLHEKTALSRKQIASRVIVRYEARVLKSSTGAKQDVTAME